MKNTYLNLIQQSFEFPQNGFHVEDDQLQWHKLPLMELIKQYGTPLKVTYLPKIGNQIKRAKRLFNVAMAKVDYQGSYTYCYCTKSSHFSFVLEEALQHDIHLETSSAYDFAIVKKLYEQGRLTKDTYIVCNGFKTPDYLKSMADFANAGFGNLVPVLDNTDELKSLKRRIKQPIKIAIRIASEEEPNFGFYTSRLGIRYNAVVPFYNEAIKDDPRFNLKMLHFFINTGITNTAYYWNELRKSLKVYCELKKVCPELDSINIGGGFPVQNSLNFKYDYEHICEEIVYQIKTTCKEEGVPEPNLFTEFGTFTVGESGAILYSVLGQKQQNDRELWYMIDSSFMTTLPDSWSLGRRFMMLPVNKWDRDYRTVNLGGLTCDSMDYYNQEAHSNQVFLPETDKREPLYIGFFHTGAYQESVGGFGGIQHCLIPAPKHIIVSVDEDGEYSTRLFSKEQSAKSMLRTLGY